MAVYLIHGRRLASEDAGFDEAVAAAHASRHRPLCLCRAAGLPMYVARLGGGFILKRMPDTGEQHAPDCTSYELPPELSGIGALKGRAIVEDPAAGTTSLKLGFALTKSSSRSNAIAIEGEGGDSVASGGSKLTMRGLLHYLWDESGLTRWLPSFAGRRSWAVVRKQLILAVEGKVARGRSLQDRLYVPEPFCVDQRDDISARRVARWSRAAGQEQTRHPLLLLVGEVKEILPARFCYKAVIKHVPDQAFMLDQTLYRRTARRFETELAQWASNEDIHMIMMATFVVRPGPVPVIEELTLMPVTPQWIPVRDAHEQQLIERLVRDERRFIKPLCYNLSQEPELASAVLTDVDGGTSPLFVVARPADSAAASDRSAVATSEHSGSNWVWWPELGSLPSLPRARRQRSAQTYA